VTSTRKNQSNRILSNHVITLNYCRHHYSPPTSPNW